MTRSTLEAVTIEPRTRHRHSLLWLHGLGADGNDFVPVAERLGLPATLGVRFVFPHAPVMPVTINGGYRMRAWYDIGSQDVLAAPDQAGIDASVAAVGHLLAQEAARIPMHRVILAGFSQGGVIALRLGLSAPAPVGGVMALSTYLPLSGEAPVQAKPFPVFWGHGVHDPVVPLAGGEAASQWLRDRGHAVAWHTYAIEHSVCPEEIDDMRRWLLSVMDTG